MPIHSCLRSTLVQTALVGLASASAVHAQAVFQQPNTTQGAWASQNDTAPFGFGNYNTAYDNFLLSSGANIATVNWVGTYFNGNPATTTGFTLNFYADNAGVPGALLQTNSIAGNANETGLELDIDGNSMFTYSTKLSTPFAATAGKQYWMSIVADLAYPPQWGWADGTGGDGAAYQVSAFSGPSSIPNDLAFSLTPTTETPEPGSIALLAGLGVTGAFGLRRRKSARKKTSDQFA